MLNEKIVPETEVVIEVYWFFSAIAATGFSTTIVFKMNYGSYKKRA
jgi:hypothetical protein